MLIVDNTPFKTKVVNHNGNFIQHVLCTVWVINGATISAVTLSFTVALRNGLYVKNINDKNLSV